MDEPQKLPATDAKVLADQAIAFGRSLEELEGRRADLAAQGTTDYPAVTEALAASYSSLGSLLVTLRPAADHARPILEAARTFVSRALHLHQCLPPPPTGDIEVANWRSLRVSVAHETAGLVHFHLNDPAAASRRAREALRLSLARWEASHDNPESVKHVDRCYTSVHQFDEFHDLKSAIHCLGQHIDFLSPIPKEIREHAEVTSDVGELSALKEGLQQVIDRVDPVVNRARELILEGRTDAVNGLAFELAKSAFSGSRGQWYTSLNVARCHALVAARAEKALPLLLAGMEDQIRNRAVEDAVRFLRIAANRGFRGVSAVESDPDFTAVLTQTEGKKLINQIRDMPSPVRRAGRAE